MAEKKSESSEAKRKREIKDAGQRVVIAGFKVPTKQLVSLIANSPMFEFGSDKAKREEAAHELLGTETTDIWIKLGQVEADSREQAVNKTLGENTPGSFRAPNASAWRGQINRRPPEQVALEVELVD